MKELIEEFKKHVIEESAKTTFVHHRWFVKWHLEVVYKIATELLDYYPTADNDLVELMVWLHDYGKILDFDNQYNMSDKYREKLLEIGFTADVTDKAVRYIEMLDKKQELDLREAPIEVQIVSSADGCSHMSGPFLPIFWNEATDKTFAGKEFEELMALNKAKVEKDWNYKIVLPEAKAAFKTRYQFIHEQSGELPDKYFS